jgi:hypothetical protein
VKRWFWHGQPSHLLVVHRPDVAVGLEPMSELYLARLVHVDGVYRMGVGVGPPIDQNLVVPVVVVPVVIVGMLRLLLVFWFGEVYQMRTVVPTQ